jgi:chromosome segregation ATPase
MPGTPAPSMPAEAEFFALLGARDYVRESLATLKKQGAETQTAVLIRALAVEAARGAAPDRFVQARHQLETLKHQHRERIKALTEFLHRFDKLVRTAKEQHPAEIEAALTAKIQQLQEQVKLPGARVAEIEAEITRLKNELRGAKSVSAARTRPKPPRRHKA